MQDLGNDSSGVGGRKSPLPSVVQGKAPDMGPEDGEAGDLRCSLPYSDVIWKTAEQYFIS